MKCLVVLAILMVLPSMLCKSISQKDPDTKDLVELPLINKLPKGYFFTYEYAPILRIVNEDLEPEGERVKRETEDVTTTQTPDGSSESIPTDDDDTRTFKLESRRFLPNTK